MRSEFVEVFEIRDVVEAKRGMRILFKQDVCRRVEANKRSTCRM